MSYEQDCNDYAVHGNPEQDHWDYSYDSDNDDLFDYCGEQDKMSPCPDCTEEADCAACTEAEAWLEEQAQLDREGCNDNAPF